VDPLELTKGSGTGRNSLQRRTTCSRSRWPQEKAKTGRRRIQKILAQTQLALAEGQPQIVRADEKAGTRGRNSKFLRTAFRPIAEAAERGALEETKKGVVDAKRQNSPNNAKGQPNSRIEKESVAVRVGP